MSDFFLPNDKIQNITAVIFDKDGTLIDIHHYWCSMIKFRAKFFVNSLKFSNTIRVYEELVDAMGVDIGKNIMKPEGPVGIKPRSFIVDVALKVIQKYDSSYTKEMVENVFKEVDEYSKENLKDIVKPLPNVKVILEKLCYMDIKVFLATTDLSYRAKLAMKSLDFEEYFLEIVGADMVKKTKPKADMIEFIVKNHNVNKNNILVVGDSMADMGMAENGGCKFLGVKTGLFTKEFIEKSYYLVNDLRELEVA